MEMTSAIALILVIHAHIMVGMSGPDLPDDFGGSGKPSISFSDVASDSPDIVRTTGTKKVSEQWLVSEEYCSLCPEAKRRFRAAGHPESHIITRAEAKRLHGKNISGVPHEYTIETEQTVTFVQPKMYRSTSRMATTLNGSAAPGKSAILEHLRRAGPHQGKRWQQWHLESWKTEQLYALHDDDHANSVPEYSDEVTVEATIENARASPGVIAAALSAHLLRDHKIDQPAEAITGLFDVTIDTPDDARGWIADMLSRESLEFPSAGVSATWKGSDRTILVTSGGIRLSPGVTVAVNKFRVSVSTTMTGCTYAPDLSWVKLDLTNAPDLTVRFK